MDFSVAGGVSRPRNLTIVLTVMAFFATLLGGAPASRAVEGDVDVIVTMVGDTETDPANLVSDAGGVLGQDLGIINGFSATIPTAAVALLERNPAVDTVVVDGSLEILADSWADASFVSVPYLDDFAGSLNSIAQSTVGAEKFWEKGYDGSGVDVALIDSGVVPVTGLSMPGKVVNGPDLSFESQADDLRYMDTYGHGTHLAGIIAGNDGTKEGFRGVAPGARILNMKVAGYDGAVDVSQVIAAIDWVVQHRYDNGMNIRVINLAYGTDSKQSPMLDPLSYAVEQAWRDGIVVVVAVGNDGNSSPLRDPAFNPYVIAIGASDSNLTASASNDVVASFTNCGTADRYVDVFAPGRSIVSLRNPGSSADVQYPEARIGDRFFLGSGTSQSAAVVSGAAALVLDMYPNATPDEVKAMLMVSGAKLKTENKYCSQGHLIGLEDIAEGGYDKLKLQSNTFRANGTGTLEGARGSDHLSVDGVILSGEQDIFGQKWDAEYWAKLSANNMSWTGGDWNGTSWSGSDWSGTSWSGSSWSGTSWSGTSWSGTSWSDYVWSGSSWSGTSWSGSSWSGTSWSGTSWSGTSWSDAGWLGLSWG